MRALYKEAYRLVRIEYRLGQMIRTHIICGGSYYSVIARALQNEKSNAHRQFSILWSKYPRLLSTYSHHHHYVKPFPRNRLGHVMKHSENPVHLDAKTAVRS